MKQLTFIITFLLVAIFIGCAPDDVPTSPGQPNTHSLGDANFTTFVSLGNSITAGYQSGALFREGQLHAFPKLIYDQAMVTGLSGGTVQPTAVVENFEIPIINEPGIGNRIYVSLTNSGASISIVPVTSLPINLSLERPYNNLAVPGAVLWIPNSDGYPISDMFQSISFLSGSSRANPLFAVILRSETFGSNMYQQAKSLNPTFITLWIGNNDVLGYATSGGTSPSMPTPDNMFQTLYKNVIDSLVTTGAQIVVANIPDVSVLPYFKIVPLPPHFSGPQGVDSNDLIFGVTKSGVRALEYGDCLTMTASAALQTGLGTQLNPLPDQFILDKDEIQIAKNSVSSFNQIIKFICDNTILKDGKPIPVVDINRALNEINNHGMHIAGEFFTSNYITGATFSFDGVHPSSKGHAIIANEFIKTINSRYNANIPFVDITKIPGLSIPLGKKSLDMGNIKFEDGFNEKFKDVLKLFQPNMK
jgi:lysophospholipase L1-like esterase